ncbi:MAG: acetyl-CoA decarbonylase/synthase complex subunit gamma [Methanospirillum sp.]|nr:acetyl-CoA decarbonylase/synthase complex subunit gamma [Methanospirillum sp.]
MARRSITETSPIEVYRLLPRTNCGECGEPNCMAFATRLVNREVSLESCPPLLLPEHDSDLADLSALLAPPVRAVRIGQAEREITLGGKYVVQRHEFTYHNPTCCALAVDDTLAREELVQRLRTISEFSYNYIGRDLRLDAVALRSATGDPDQFREAATTIAATCKLPLVLCSPDPDVLRVGAEAVPGRRPLLHAADRTNWREMALLALDTDSPLVVSAPDDLSGLRSLTKTLRAWGIEDLVLDPGTFVGPGLAHTIRNFSRCRNAAIRDGDELLGYPLLGAPIAAFAGEELDPVRCAFDEALTASVLLSRYADILILQGLEGWSVLPTLIWRFNLYTDPRKPVAVEAGLREFGSPDRVSPVLVTANYALTYFTVESDIKAANISCYLVVADTGGLSVESAVAGRYFSAAGIAEALESSGVAEKVDHRVLVIPGLAARLSGEAAEATGWKVLVGPKDSSGLGPFMKERWPPGPA